MPGQEGKTLDRYIYDCPGEDKVTFWSKRSGVAYSDPDSMDAATEMTMDSLVQVELVRVRVRVRGRIRVMVMIRIGVRVRVSVA